MKQIITTCLLLSLAAAAPARISTLRKVLPLRSSQTLEHAKFELAGANVSFTDLPKKDMELYIMDTNGIIEQSGVISRKNNTVNVSALAGGNHIIALRQGSNVVVFGMLAEVTIKG